MATAAQAPASRTIDPGDRGVLVGSEIIEDRLYITGQWSPPDQLGDDPRRLTHTGEHLGAVPEGREPDVDAAVTAAREALPELDGSGTRRASTRPAPLRDVDRGTQGEDRATGVRAERYAHRRRLPAGGIYL